MRRLLQAALSTAVVFLAPGCGGHAGQSVVPEMKSRDLTVEVRNYNFYDATIYAWDSGERLRLGMAQGKSTSTFTFRWDLGDVRFIIHFIGVGDLVGESLPVDPGDDLILIVGQEDHRRAQRPEQASMKSAEPEVILMPRSSEDASSPRGRN